MEWTLEEEILRNIDRWIQQYSGEMDVTEDESEYDEANGKVKGLILAQRIVKKKFEETGNKHLLDVR